MRRVLLLTAVLAGCAAPERYQAYDVPRPQTAQEREADLRGNVRDGRTWAEQERRMADLKAAFGPPSDADVLGPKTASPAR
jgi:hypothetical protein